PAKPKRFYGRQTELDTVLEAMSQDAPRVAILGGGGMGKTSLARAVLHHPQICARFQHRFFVSSESATTDLELAALTGLHLGLEAGPDLRNPVIRVLSRGPPVLLILDNLETPWEPTPSRAGVEEFLSLLTDIDHLALLITMRGAERPARVRWTRPFLQSLQPLSDDAAEKTFNDITDNSCQGEERTQLLQLTENMPLAIELMAHLVDYEGSSNVLTRWKMENTGVLSIGHNKGSNLNVSIELSLASPRLSSSAQELLSLLSLLPDGLSDDELSQTRLPISDVHSGKSVLLATSLAYRGTNRLRVLAPIREYVRSSSPPSQSLVYAVQEHFHQLLALYQQTRG
ncbi:P-loop containing nucleoside triphosphate hydrolase protein, partial [Mycena metata]